MEQNIKVSVAYTIVEQYRSVPPTRQEQQALLRLRGYDNKLNERPFSQCSDQQIYSVAKRVLGEAYNRVKSCEAELSDFLAEYRSERNSIERVIE
mgnify:CR=1 FL=1